jgi:hypothetical protein
MAEPDAPQIENDPKPQITPEAARPDDPGPHPKSHPMDGHAPA